MAQVENDYVASTTLDHSFLRNREDSSGCWNLESYVGIHLCSQFRARVRQLPQKLYPDSPAGEQGDRDKLQHFFGAAAVAYATESADAARTAGTLVEWGESVVVVGGVDDPRDLRSNIQGEMFGHDLLYIATMLPSDYLRVRVHVQ